MRKKHPQDLMDWDWELGPGTRSNATPNLGASTLFLKSAVKILEFWRYSIEYVIYIYVYMYSISRIYIYICT